MVVLLALGVVVPVTVVALGVRRITRPVAEITKAAEEIAGGDFSQRIDVRTGDELETLGRQFNAMAVELQASYAHLEQRVSDRTRELSTLNALAAVVSRSLELDEVMNAALRKTLETMDMEAGGAFRLTEHGKLSLMAARGLSDLFVDQVREMDLEQSLAAQAVGESAPVLREVDDYPDGALRDGLRGQGFRSVVSVPLVARDATVGVLNLATREARTLSPEERALLASVGRQAGMAVENARLYEHAEAAAAAAERNRLARELHDAVSQTLFSASMIADVLPRLWEKHPEEAERRLADLRRLTRGAMAEMRTLLWELRPSALMEADLDELLGQLSKAIAGRAQLEVLVKVDPGPAVPPEVKVALYRIAQEALNNVVRHAGADEVVLSVRGDDEGIELSVRDDGRGFVWKDIPPGHLGLSTMRERAESIGAEITVESVPGKGTSIRVLWRGGDGDQRRDADSCDARR
jgi:nitrate/nitrite-specific signal transduction histidine kinase